MRTWRVARVVAGITIVSAGAGALAGLLGVALLVTVSDGVHALFRHPDLYGFGAELGALCGLVLGPLGAFGFMRRVPLGRLFAQTTLGAAIFGAAACFLPIGVTGILAVGAAGFLTAGARLAWVARRESPRDMLPPAA